MSWLGLQNNLDKVGSKLAGLSEAADAVTQQISSAARQLSALQDQQRSFKEQFGKPGPQIPGMTSEQSRAFAEQLGKPGPQIPGMTSEQSRAFAEQFGKPGPQIYGMTSEQSRAFSEFMGQDNQAIRMRDAALNTPALLRPTGFDSQEWASWVRGGDTRSIDLRINELNRRSFADTLQDAEVRKISQRIDELNRRKL